MDAPEGITKAGWVPRIALIDYHKGNIKSVERALQSCGADVYVTDRPCDVLAAEAVVLPGVGAFSDAMATLVSLGLDRAILDAVGRGTPFLGICLGLHLMFESGTEHAPSGKPACGLGIIPGTVDAMPKCGLDAKKHKVPHVGWNSVDILQDSELFSGIESGEYFYFTHSFVAPPCAYAIAATTHSVTFPSAVRKGNAYGVQFHPEKSSSSGARLVSNFVKMAGKGRT